jgi:predicted O-methyltransferase YrrM
MPGKPAKDLVFHPPYMPSMCAEALDKLNQISLDADILEVGSGASSLYFLERARSFYSLEHDPDWYAVIERSLDGKPNPVRLVEPEKLASRVKYLRKESYDLVYIDCLQPYRRPAAENAVGKLRLGGYLVVDDYHFPELCDFQLPGWEFALIEGRKVHPVHGKLVYTSTAFFKRVK